MLNELAAPFVVRLVKGFKDGCSSPSWKVDAILRRNSNIILDTAVQAVVVFRKMRHMMSYIAWSQFSRVKNFFPQNLT